MTYHLLREPETAIDMEDISRITPNGLVGCCFSTVILKVINPIGSMGLDYLPT